jgi:hypothetical protein
MISPRRPYRGSARYNFLCFSLLSELLSECSEMRLIYFPRVALWDVSLMPMAHDGVFPSAQLLMLLGLY